MSPAKILGQDAVLCPLFSHFLEGVPRDPARLANSLAVRAAGIGRRRDSRGEPERDFHDQVDRPPDAGADGRVREEEHRFSSAGFLTGTVAAKGPPPAKSRPESH